MEIAEDEVAVTLNLPRSLVDRIGESAGRDNHTLEDEIRGLIGMALAIDEDPKELAVRAAQEYAAHLRVAGRSRPSTEELWEQMRSVREELADELYPD